MKTPDISPAIGEYLAASEAKLPVDWYDKVLWQRSYCAKCGQTYKIENLRICTRCQDLNCYPWPAKVRVIRRVTASADAVES